MKISFTHPHSLGRDSAKREVGLMADDIASQLQITHRWEGDSLRFSRAGADGRIDVFDGSVDVDVELTGMLASMKSLVEMQLRSALAQRLGT